MDIKRVVAILKVILSQVSVKKHLIHFIVDSPIYDLIKVHRRNKILSKQIVETFNRRNSKFMPLYDLPNELKVTIDNIISNPDYENTDISSLKFRPSTDLKTFRKKRRSH